MECIWDLTTNLKEVRRCTWMFIHTNMDEPMSTQLKSDYQNIINESVFGFDMDTLIARLDAVSQNQNKTEKMAIDVLLEQKFISLDATSMVPLEGRLIQLFYFFKQAFPDRNEEIHRSMARMMLIRHQCNIRALLYHSKTGHAINFQPEWHLTSLMPIAPAISSPFSLIQILTRNKELRFPWHGAHNATIPYSMDSGMSASEGSRRSSLNSEADISQTSK